jgi:hypothetical protein
VPSTICCELMDIILLALEAGISSLNFTPPLGQI